jgi:hypothetical protein
MIGGIFEGRAFYSVSQLRATTEMELRGGVRRRLAP